MITRLEVDGFKSLRDFAVDLEPFTVFIGPNGAGKSNILEALGLLSRLARMPIVEAFQGGRGRASDQFSRHADERAHVICLAAEFLFFGTVTMEGETSPNNCSRFRYELELERVARPSGTERLKVRRESLRTLTSDEDAWIQARPRFGALVTPQDKACVHYLRSGEVVTTLPGVYPEELRPDPRRTMLARFNGGLSQGAEDYTPQNLGLCQWLRLDLAHLAGPSERLDGGALHPDGSNLPTVLADLLPQLLGEIRADLVALVPGISSFAVVPEGEALRIDFELSGGERIPARLVSDGTLRLLALLTTLRLDERPYLIGIEEPENGIYPGRLRALVELLRDEAEQWRHEDPAWLAANIEPRRSISADMSTDLLPPQILLTTHSPVMLAALREHLDALRFVDVVHSDGRRVTRARTIARSRDEPRHRAVSVREIDLLLHTVSGGLE